MTKFISLCFGFLADLKLPRFAQKLVNRAYIAFFKIDLSRFGALESYASLNALFTRGLRELREFDKSENILISPCDGFVMECGKVEQGRALQIKGFSYSVASLLGIAPSAYDTPQTRDFKMREVAVLERLFYANLYLSPRDYHRYHAPCDMWVEKVAHFRGALLPVHRTSLRKNQNLFVRNERIVLFARMQNGARLYFIAVGALNVGSMIFYFEPKLSEKFKGKSREFSYQKPHFIRKGEEMGMFKMGGSTIVLFIEAQNAPNILKHGENITFGDALFRV